MKYGTSSKLAVVAVLSASIVSCNALKKMAKRQNEVNYSATPNPLVLKGDSIQVTIKGSFPAKYFNKKVSGVITPTLKYGTDSSTATFKPFTIKGESVQGAGTTISYEKGGSFTYTAETQYKKGMDQAVLDLDLVGKYKSKSKAFDPVKVADGTIITQLLVQSKDAPIIGANKFQKTHPLTSEAKINYVVGTTHRIPSSLRTEAVKNMIKTSKKWADDTTHYRIKGASVLGYASPEGETSNNTELASNRSKDGVSYAKKMLVKDKVNGAKKDGFYTNEGKGEDWAGFKSAIDNSTKVKNKELITRVLEMYKNPSTRQNEIRNIAATYPIVKNTILPQLRRAEITINADSLSRPDAQIAALAKSNPDSLNAEELLYAATLTKDLNQKQAIFTSFAKIHPNDWRGPNNLGYVALMKNDLNTAKSEFQKAAQMAPNNKVVENNLGVVARLSGNNQEALADYKKAEGAGPQVKANEGIVNILLGNYADAVSDYAGINSFNAALAQLLNGDADAAMKTIEASNDKNTAMGYYLKAVIGARKADKDMVVSNLKSATSQDASLKAAAKKDLEFIKYRKDAEFQAAVN